MPQLAGTQLPVYPVVDWWHHFHLQVEIETHFDYLVAVVNVHTLYGNNELTHPVAAHKIGSNCFIGRHDGNAFERFVYLAAVIVNKGNDVVMKHAVLQQGVSRQHTGSAGTVDHHPYPSFVLLLQKLIVDGFYDKATSDHREHHQQEMDDGH